HRGVENQDAHAHLNARKGVLDPGQVREVVDEPRQDGDNDQRREHHPQGGHNAPGDALVFLADERGRVDSDDPRRALPDGIVVRQFLLCGPVLVLHHFPLENRQHRHAAAE
ncbi:Short-chain dehydrogenase, partial [Dysosmobacter welbionis]